MRKVEFNRSQVVKYLIWTFAIAWAIQACVAVLYNKGNSAIGQMVMAGMMFVPTLGVLLSGGKLSGMGWNPRIPENIKPILIAWFAPAVLTAIGVILFFLVFPGYLDLTGSTLAAGGASEALDQMAAKGITYPIYILIGVVSALSYGPLINTFVSLGEEIGWRGFLYPQLKSRFGRRKGWLLGDTIWGAWHWPLIWLIGYEYGPKYVGFPVVGMLVFCLFTIALGILSDWLYEKSGSIWLPSICHGAVNAAAGVPLMVCLPDIGSARLLGPAPNGLIAGLPILAVGAILLIRGKKEIESN